MCCFIYLIALAFVEYAVCTLYQIISVLDCELRMPVISLRLRKGKRQRKNCNPPLHNFHDGRMKKFFKYAHKKQLELRLPRRVLKHRLTRDGAIAFTSYSIFLWWIDRIIYLDAHKSHICAFFGIGSYMRWIVTLHT